MNAFHLAIQKRIEFVLAKFRARRRGKFLLPYAINCELWLRLNLSFEGSHGEWLTAFVAFGMCRKFRIPNSLLVDCASLYNLFHTKPSRCTLFLSIFIWTAVHVSGNYVSIIKRTYCTYTTLVFFTLYGWLCGLSGDTNRQTRQPPIQSGKYQCRISTVSSPYSGHIVARNM